MGVVGEMLPGTVGSKEAQVGEKVGESEGFSEGESEGGPVGKCVG